MDKSSHKKYYISVNYDSGDSFNQYPGEVCICIEEWDNLDIAKENLKRITDHYKAYKAIHGWGNYGKDTWADYKDQPWYSEKYTEYTVVLLKDDNTTYDESCTWVGYFETMNFAEIIAHEDDMKIYV